MKLCIKYSVNYISTYVNKKECFYYFFLTWSLADSQRTFQLIYARINDFLATDKTHQNIIVQNVLAVHFKSVVFDFVIKILL